MSRFRGRFRAVVALSAVLLFGLGFVAAAVTGSGGGLQGDAPQAAPDASGEPDPAVTDGPTPVASGVREEPSGSRGAAETPEVNHDEPPTFSTFDDDLVAAATADDAPSEGVSSVFLADAPALADPAFQAFAEGLTDLGDGLYEGTITAADIAALDQVEGLKVSRSVTYSATPLTMGLSEDDEPGRMQARRALGADGGADVEAQFSPYVMLYESWVTVPEVDPTLAATRTSLGRQGTGQVIAIMDTGVDTGALGLGGGKVIHREDFAAGACDGGYLDPSGHGTHVASIAAGAINAQLPQVHGVAPGASIVDVRVLDCNGNSKGSTEETSSVILGLKWVLDNHEAYDITVLNMSLGADSGTQDGLDVLSTLVNRLVADGVFVSLAAGNSGDGKSTIYSPGASEFGTTVGSVGVSPLGTYLSSFSSQGPIAGRNGVDVLAAGSSIRAAQSTAEGYDQLDYGLTKVIGGTSMSAPYVAGLAALLLQDGVLAPSGTDCSVSSCSGGVNGGTMSNPVLDAMVTSDWFAAGPDDISGRGLVNATASLLASAAPASPSATATMNPASAVWIEIPAQSQPFTVNVVTDNHVSASTGLYYGWFTATGEFEPVSVACDATVTSGLGCIWGEPAVDRRVWNFSSPATSETTYLWLTSPDSEPIDITAHGVVGAISVSEGIATADVTLNSSGTATATITRTATSASPSTVALAPSTGIDTPASVNLPAGPAGTSAQFTVQLAGGFVPSSPYNAARVAMTVGGSLVDVVSVRYASGNVQGGQVTVGGTQVTTDALVDSGVWVSSNGTILGNSYYPGISRSPGSGTALMGQYVVDSKTTEAQQLAINQTVVSSLTAYSISGDGSRVLLSQPGTGSGIVPGDGDSRTNYFVHDRNTLANVEIGSATIVPSTAVDAPIISEDGKAVVFATQHSTGSSAQYLYVQRGANLGTTTQLATFPLGTTLRLRGASANTALVDIYVPASGLWQSRLYPLAGGAPTVVATGVLGDTSTLSGDGSAVAYVGSGAVRCYTVSTSTNTPIDMGAGYVGSSVAAGPDCSYVTMQMFVETDTFPEYSAELVQGQPGQSRTVLATAPDEGTAWVFDSSATNIVTYTGDQLVDGDTNGVYDLYAGVVSPDLSPRVYAVTPGYGPKAGGTAITITGTKFAGATSVTIGGVAATGLSVVSDSQLTVTTPPGTSATAPVVVTTPEGASAATAAAFFAYVDSTVVMGVPNRVVEVDNFAPGSVQCFPVVGKAGVPVGAVGAVVNVTAAHPNGSGFVVVYPDTAGNGATTAPGSSTVNFESGQAVANTAFVALPANGDICAYSQGATLNRLLIDVSGYILPGSGIELQSAQRVLDTRSSTSNAGPVAPGTDYVVKVAGKANVPNDAAAVVVNVTVAGVKSGGHLRMWETGTTMPGTSVVNYAPGQTKANAQIVALSPGGELSFRSFTGVGTAANPVQVIIDVVGWVDSDSAFTATSPTRIVETRNPPGVVGPITTALTAGSTYSVPISNMTLVPGSATAVVLNVTAAGPTGGGHIRVYPGTNGVGTPPPLASNINYIRGRAIPNLVVVQLPPNRTINFYNGQAGSNTTHLIVDVVGYIE